MHSIQEIVETGSFTSKERLNETIEALRQRAKYYREQVAKNRITIENAANEIITCRIWIKCFTEMRDSL